MRQQPGEYGTGVGRQIFSAAVLHQSPVGQDRYRVEPGDGIQAMSNDNRRSPAKLWEQQQARPIRELAARLVDLDEVTATNAATALIHRADGTAELPDVRVLAARPAAAIVVAHGPLLGGRELDWALRHPSRFTRAAGVFAVDQRPNAPLPSALVDLLDDPSFDVRASVLRLLAERRVGDAVPRIADGLRGDLEGRRLANFAARTGALAALTGKSVSLEAPLGIPLNDDRMWSYRAEVAGQWLTITER